MSARAKVEATPEEIARRILADPFYDPSQQDLGVLARGFISALELLSSAQSVSTEEERP